MSTGDEAEVVDGELLPECGRRGCSVTARPGTVLCDAHSAEQMVLSAQRRLALAAPEAAETLIAVSQNADSADVRRRAAEAILDRAGVRAGIDVTVTAGTEPATSPADLLRERLALLRRRTLEGAAEEARPLESVTDGHDQGSDA